MCAESQQDNFLDHLILSIFPDEGVARDMDFFTVHFDDSGTAPDQQIALAACYLGTVEQWREFNRNWADASEEEGFGTFHMAEFAAGEKQFKNWSIEKKKHVLDRLCNIITTRARCGFATAVAKSDYDEIVTGHFRRYCGGFHYTFAIRQTVGRVAMWRTRYSPKSSMRYVFDWMESGLPARREIEYLLDAAVTTSEFQKKRIGVAVLKGYSFERKSSILPLQAADILAWTVYQKMQNRMSNRPLCWEATQAYESLKRQGSLDDGYFIRDNLKRWAEAELSVLVEKLQAEGAAMRKA